MVAASHRLRSLQKSKSNRNDTGVAVNINVWLIAARDGSYMASITENGWPYIQFRGGRKGFLHMLDDSAIGFADLSGNRQYITVGNLQKESRVALFLMDYVAQRRIKMFGHALTYEGTPETDKLDSTAAEIERPRGFR